MLINPLLMSEYLLREIYQLNIKRCFIGDSWHIFEDDKQMTFQQKKKTKELRRIPIIHVQQEKLVKGVS
jgi:hypothetical protein